MSAPSNPVRVLLVGAAGRFGSAVLQECRREGIECRTAPRDGDWPAAVPGTIVVDAGNSAGLDATLAYCERYAAGLVYPVSGLGEVGRRRLTRLAATVPVLLAPNLSIGHWLQRRLLAELARCSKGLRAQATVIERHPRTKTDPVSATAQVLAADWTDRTGDQDCDIISLRLGHRVADHLVRVDLAHESVVIEHEVRDLTAPARGVILAVRAVAGAGPGLIQFNRVLDDLLAAS